MNSFRTDKVALGHRLQVARLNANLSQEKLAEALGTSVRSVQRWERGQAVPHGYSRERLCQVLQLSQEALFGKASEGQSLPPASKLWCIPHPRNPFFTGREDLLRRLHLALFAPKMTPATRSRALIGLGGLGKTQLAIEYAYRHMQDYSAIFWLKAETTESFLASLHYVAEQLQLPQHQEAESTQLIRAIQRWLSKHSGWLLVGDNLEDDDLLQTLLPPDHQGALLFTTRRRTLGSLAEPVELPLMTCEEGTTFLLRRARLLALATTDQPGPSEACPRAPDAAAAELVQLLEGLPLALDQAGAYIEETGCSVADYLQRCRTQRKQVLARRGIHGGAHPASVTTTLMLSVGQAEQTHPAAGELLRICAFLHPESIPENLLMAGASYLGPLLGPVVADHYQFDLAVAALRNVSLLTRHTQARTLSVHRLVQAIVQESLSEQEQTMWQQRVVHLLQTAWPGGELNTWAQCEHLLPHVLTCTAAIGDAVYDQELVALLHKAGDYLVQRGRYEQAERVLRQALRAQEYALGLNHPQVVSSLARLAAVLRKQGHCEQAEALYRRALSLCEHSLGLTHPEVARLLTRLAALLTDWGNYKQAEPLYQRALSIWEQQAQGEPLEIARVLNGLAVMLRNQGKYEEAERLYERALHLREQMLGSVHPELAMTLSNLATVAQGKGNYEQAERLCQRALSIWEQTVGLTHPDAAYALSNLGEVYREQKRYEQAQGFSRRAFCLWKKTLGPDHVLVSHALNNLAKIAYVQGKQKRAEVLFKRGLEIRECQLEPTHPAVVYSLENLATLYRDQGKYEQAAPLYQRAMALTEQRLGPTHHWTEAIRRAYEDVVERCSAAAGGSQPGPQEQA